MSFNIVIHRVELDEHEAADLAQELTEDLAGRKIEFERYEVLESPLSVEGQVQKDLERPLPRPEELPRLPGESAGEHHERWKRTFGINE